SPDRGLQQPPSGSAGRHCVPPQPHLQFWVPRGEAPQPGGVFTPQTVATPFSQRATQVPHSPPQPQSSAAANRPSTAALAITVDTAAAPPGKSRTSPAADP